MTDTPEVPEGLRPANENPWYVLMTLYGEQEAEAIDWELHEKNRKLWNAWSVHGTPSGMKFEDYLREMSRALGVSVQECDMGEWGKLINAQHYKEERVQDRFARVWKERNGEGSLAPEIPAASEAVDFSNTRFERLFCARKMAFSRGVTLKKSQFKKGASFERCLFATGSNFAAGFHETADFAASQFWSHADFSAAEFKKGATFSDCVFEKRVSFSGSSFREAVSFQSTVFKGLAQFTRATFRQLNSASVTFRDAEFCAASSFSETYFCSVYPDFSGAVLHDKTSFTARMLPTSDEIAKDNTLLGQTYWPKTTKQDPVNARDSCATIRHVLTKQGLPEEAHFFFRREMHFAGLPSEGRSFAERLPYILFGWFSDYGYSIQRPLWWLAGVWLAGLLTFAYLFALPQDYPKLAKYDDWTAMGLSFSNLFPLFGFGRVFLSDVLMDLPRWAQFLSGTQTVLSLPLLFFLGLGLRQRFRLR
ncbi:pentapeptide repeat-containing protein [Arenibacterium sp. LLYu02]|uniref:pentapeptide repeat-containing protein n=1 Tax=Arenibacterium sp. LLYu02 TaxID=3404132 RepID=UPI003B226CE1